MRDQKQIDLPIDVESLNALYYKASNMRRPTVVAIRFFSGRLERLLDNYQDSKDISVQKVLTRHQLNYIRFALNYPDDIELTISDMERCISSLAKHGLLKHFVEHENYAQVIACICIKLVHWVKYNYVHPEKHNVDSVLRQWSAKELGLETLSSVEGITSYLYGEACFHLYCQDTTNIGQLAHVLWQLQPPLVGTIKNNDNATTDLPFDLA